MIWEQDLYGVLEPFKLWFFHFIYRFLKIKQTSKWYAFLILILKIFRWLFQHRVW